MSSGEQRLNCARMDDMSLKSETLSYQGNGTKKMETILAALDPEEHDELLELLEDPFIEGTAIARALRARKFDISESAVQRYRKKMKEDS
jgi:hypothetical protein